MLHILVTVALLLLSSTVGVQAQSIIKNLPSYAGDLPFTLETGYIGVGEMEEVQLFYYFIQSERSPKDDPLLLWLTGGPGCSSFFGLVYEIGPLEFDYSNCSGKKTVFKLNPYSWTRIANIIFLDAPVGTGFSYANTWSAYYSNDTLSATQTYEFLRKWLMRHPQFLSNELYVAGDSYSGKVVPIIVQEVSNGNEVGLEPQMNLRGYVLGNPVTCEEKDNGQRIPFACKMALISEELYESTKTNCNGDYINIDPSNAACLVDLETVSTCTVKINLPQILEPSCDFLAPDPSKLTWNRYPVDDSAINLLKPGHAVSGPWCRYYNYLWSYIWANDKTVQEAIHVREGTKEEWNRCNETLAYTKNVLNSVVYHRNLTKKNLRALIYSGDHDFLVPYMGTLDWIKSLNLTILSPWAPWFVNGQVAGYSTVHHEDKYELTYTTIKGGGHTAPEYKPEECFSMIERWLAYYPL